MRKIKTQKGNLKTMYMCRDCPSDSIQMNVLKFIIPKLIIKSEYDENQKHLI